MDGLLRKKDLVSATGLAKSTVADWIIDFHVYIPTVKHGAVTYYRPEAIDVLNAIRELREQDYSKVQIIELLSKKGFPITVEEAIADVERILSQADSRDTLLTVMQTMSQTIVEVAKQAELQNRLEARFDEHIERLDGQDGRINEMLQTMQDLQRQLDETIIELAATKERANLSIWKRIFRRP